MEILGAGAFINLENREKIEQLRYTATELAKAAIETEGFINTEAEARKLALEFWHGLEYMCRETERGTIQNIFIGQFLDHLHGLRPATTMSEIAAINEAEPTVPEPVHQTNIEKDEFLGVLVSENQEIESVQDQDENRETPFIAENSTLTKNDLTDELPIEVTEPVTSELDLTEPEENDTYITDPADCDELSLAQDFETEEVETKGVEISQSLNLPEKEPYQFNKCTVTATIQLLPIVEKTNLRRAVLSVKTHDFTPDISLVEISAIDLTATLGKELERIFANYQANLPVKVMDKMKQEKSTVKKTKPATETNTAQPTAPKAKEVSDASNKVTETAQRSSNTIAPAAETGAQGSLFGF